jgi:hypothetical protein
MKSALATHHAWSMDQQSWQTVAGVIFATQVAFFLVGLGVDRIWFPDTSQGFFLAMALFGVLVGIDAMLAGFTPRRAAIWAVLVTGGWIFGAIPYARRRQHARQGAA